MIDIDETKESQANILCKSCGLCCTGHLFIWVRLNANELNSAQALGLNVIRSDPRQRGFTQPCPLWAGDCTVYASPGYPRQCRSYQCKLLKKLMGENIPLPESLNIIEQAKRLITELEILLPASPNPNFRECLITHIENENSTSDFRLKADALLDFYKNIFGVNDLVEKPEQE